MPGAWSSILSSAASYLGNKSANDSTNAANLRNTQLNNELQERLSRTGHQREVKDLRAAGLNPILSARGSGSPQPSSAAAKVEPKPSLGSAAINAAQIQLLHSQARKTSAEALNAELQEPYNRAISDVYSSILGAPAVAGKALGHVATGYGMYRGAKAVGRFMRKRKAKVLPESKPLTNLQKQKLRKLHDLKTKSGSARRRAGVRYYESFNKKTGEVKPRWSRAEALRKAGESTKYGLRRFGGRRFRFR